MMIRYKFKSGDLVRHNSANKYYGIGIIVSPNKVFGLITHTKYDVFWIKKGLKWHFEEQLESLQ